MDAASFRRTSWHVLGLWTLAVAQPLLDLLGRNPTFFIAHRADPVHVVAMVGGLLFAVPAVLAGGLWLLERLAGRRAFRAGLGVTIAVLVAACVMLAAKHAGAGVWTVAVPPAAAVGALAAWAYLRTDAAKTFATVLALSALVVPALFFAQPGVRRLLSASPGPGRTGEVRLRAGVPKPSSPVLLVVMDETPLLSLLDGRRLIDPVLYPNLAGLARDGVWFRNATAVSDDTRWAVPAILSGRYPEPGLVPTQSDYPHTLFTQLAGTHRLEVVETITRLCRFAACNAPRTPIAARAAQLADDLRILYAHRVLTDDLRASLPPLSADWARWGVAGAVDRRRQRAERAQRSTNNLQIATDFAGWISRADPQPVFYFLHSLLPHSPWQWLPSGQRNATRTPIPEAGTPGVPESEWGVALQHQRHLLQTGAVDHVIGLYVQRLKDEGLYDRTLLIVLADHGVAFQAGLPRREFRPQTAAEVMRVPLLVKFPHGERRVPGTIQVEGQTISDRNAETIDVAPTVLDVLGLVPAAAPDGATLRRAIAEERPVKRIVAGATGVPTTFPPGGPDLEPALASKTTRFGSRENPYRVPRPARFAGLLGRAVADLDVRDGQGRATVDRLAAFLNFQARRATTPFDLAGRLAAAQPGRVTWIAIAVNGTVRAVTRTWESAPGRWLATPPLDAWNRGPNQVDVFLVLGEDEAPVLLRTTAVESPGNR